MVKRNRDEPAHSYLVKSKKRSGIRDDLRILKMDIVNLGKCQIYRLIFNKYSDINSTIGEVLCGKGADYRNDLEIPFSELSYKPGLSLNDFFPAFGTT